MCCAIPHVARTRLATQLAQIQIGMRRRPNVRSSRRSQHATTIAHMVITLATTIAHMVNGIMDIMRAVTGTMDLMRMASGIMDLTSMRNGSPMVRITNGITNGLQQQAGNGTMRKANSITQQIRMTRM